MEGITHLQLLTHPTAPSHPPTPYNGPSVTLQSLKKVTQNLAVLAS